MTGPIRIVAHARASLVFLLIAGSWAYGQMTIPTTGVLPSGVIDHSLILGDDLADFQVSWVTPVNSVQASWKNLINNAANGAIVGSPPATYSAAASQSSIAEAAGLRFAMTGSTSDLNKVVTALLNADVPGGTFITRPEVLTSYLSAYDYVRGASTADLSMATRTAIEGKLRTLTNSLDNGNGTYSNARGKIGATRAMAGVLLQDATLLNTGLSDLSGHFDYTTTDDGWFTDSPGHYLNYTLRHVSLFARVYEQGSGVDLSSNLKPYIDMAIGLRLPDGNLPNVSNGLVLRSGVPLLSTSTDPTAASLAMWSLQSGTPANYNGYAGTNILNNVNTPTTYFALINFADVPATAPSTSPTFLAEGQSKVSVFRTDWTTSSDYLLMSAGIDPEPIYVPGYVAIPGFHTHNDSMEILVASQGKYILVAGGYQRSDLSNSPPNVILQTADYHNVVLVDGDVGTTVAQIGGGSNLGQMRRPEDVLHTNRLDSTEFGQFKGVSDFATLETAYNGVTVRRNTAFANEDYFVVADRMDGDANHTYGFNLVGRGTRTVLHEAADRMEVRWEYDGAQVIEHLFSTGSMSLTTDTKWMHREFNDYEVTYRMLAEISGEDDLFLSVIETGVEGDPSHLSITQLVTASDSLALAVTHLVEGWQDTIFTQFGHSAHSAGDLTTDANYAYLRTLAGALQSLMMAEGTSVDYLGDQVIELSNRSTLSMAFATNLALGTISGDGFLVGTTLRYFDRGLITGAWLNGSAIAFSNSGGIGEVVLPGSGELRVEFSAVPEFSSCVTAGLGLSLMAWVGRPRRSRASRN